MKKLEIVVRSEKLDDVKAILDTSVSQQVPWCPTSWATVIRRDTRQLTEAANTW